MAIKFTRTIGLSSQYAGTNEVDYAVEPTGLSAAINAAVNDIVTNDGNVVARIVIMQGEYTVNDTTEFAQDIPLVIQGQGAATKIFIAPPISTLNMWHMNKSNVVVKDISFESLNNNVWVGSTIIQIGNASSNIMIKNIVCNKYTHNEDSNRNTGTGSLIATQTGATISNIKISNIIVEDVDKIVSFEAIQENITITDIFIGNKYTKNLRQGQIYDTRRTSGSGLPQPNAGVEVKKVNISSAFIHGGKGSTTYGLSTAIDPYDKNESGYNTSGIIYRGFQNYSPIYAFGAQGSNQKSINSVSDMLILAVQGNTYEKRGLYISSRNGQTYRLGLEKTFIQNILYDGKYSANVGTSGGHIAIHMPFGSSSNIVCCCMVQFIYSGAYTNINASNIRVISNVFAPSVTQPYNYTTGSILPVNNLTSYS